MKPDQSWFWFHEHGILNAVFETALFCGCYYGNNKDLTVIFLQGTSSLPYGC